MAKLDQVATPLRVIDANYFLIVEALKTVLTNTDQVMSEAQEDGPKGLTEGAPQKQGEGLEQLMNASPLAFGQVNVPSGAQTRAAFDQKPVSQMGLGEMSSLSKCP